MSIETESTGFVLDHAIRVALVSGNDEFLLVAGCVGFDARADGELKGHS